MTFSGMGVLETTATGLRAVATPTCVSPAEIAEAKQKCPNQVLRGLGVDRAEAPMSGRLAPFSPCDIKRLGVCPPPACLDKLTQLTVATCLVSGRAGEFDCNPLVLAGLAALPNCGGQGVQPPVPNCLDAAWLQIRDYCGTHPVGGPNKAMNAWCWLAGRDPAWRAKLFSTPACAAPPGGGSPPSGGGVPGMPGGGGPGVPPAVDDGGDLDDLDEGGEHGVFESGMFGVGGILLLLAAGGAGYYLYRKNKKKG